MIKKISINGCTLETIVLYMCKHYSVFAEVLYYLVLSLLYLRVSSPLNYNPSMIGIIAAPHWGNPHRAE